MKKTIIFSFTSAGLFSEINNFLLTVLYASKNNYQIKIDFSSLDGINENDLKKILDIKDFPKVFSNSIRRVSTRSWRTYIYGYSGYYKILQLIKYIINNTYFIIYSKIKNIDVDLFQKHWQQIRRLRLNLTQDDKLFLYTKANQLWIYKKEIDNNNNYIGVHLRRGDKIIETEFITIEMYINEIKKQSAIYNIKKVLVFTDSIKVGKQIQQKLDDFDVTILNLDENGYFHKEFLQLPYEVRLNKTFQLCNIVNKMVLATHYIGSNDGNLSAFISLLRNGKNITDLRKSKLLIY